MPTKRLVSSPQTVQFPTSALAPAPARVPETFTDGLPLPGLVVFDLDYTLWPFWVDTHVSGRLTPKDNNTKMTDRSGSSYTFYPDVPAILSASRAAGLTLGLASRTHTPDLARDMLRGIHVRADPSSAPGSPEDCQRIPALDFFPKEFAQIYPGSKVAHFRKMQEASRRAGREVRYEDMLFFDDEMRNRNVERELGVCFWEVRNGVDCAEVDGGIREWRRRRGVDK